MPCPTDADFQKFFADELSGEVEEQIAEHLEACSGCRQRSEMLCGGSDLQTAKEEGGTLGGDVDDATRGDIGRLRSSLYRFVSDEAKPASGLSEPSAELFRLLTAEATDDVAGARLNRFTIRRWLGAGSFGVVYLAYDELLHRLVALKLPRAQPLVRREVRERFLREAEVAARLHHANVVPVFEAGQEQGICYIASSYCAGPTLHQWLEEQAAPVPLETALSIVHQLAEAVQHAHEHQVLHRDIKPGNILLEPSPADRETLTPMITDFGLAKLLATSDEEGEATGSQGLLGTPRYMAPEQAMGQRQEIGPGTDVFALGAILYELLVNVAPYAGADQAQTLHRLLYGEIIAPRRLRKDVPRDVESICLKCLERKSEDRYPTAQALADDLQRFEAGRPTLARPLGRVEMLRRWALRQPALAALLLISTLGLLTILGVLVSYSYSLETFNREMRAALLDTQRAQRRVESQRLRLSNLLYVSRIELAYQALQENDLRQAETLLAEVREANPEVTEDFVWRYLQNLVGASGQLITESKSDIYCAEYSPSRDQIAAAGAAAILQVLDGHTFQPRITVPTEQGEINAVSFTPDGRTVATAGDDGTVQLWDSRSGRLRHSIPAHQEFAYGVQFSRDGKTLVSCGREPIIRLWNVDDGRSEGTLVGHQRTVDAIDLSPDGMYLASAGADNAVRIWDLRQRRSLRVLEEHEERVIDVQFSQDGRFVLSGSLDRTMRLWRVSDGKCLQVATHVDAIDTVTFLAGTEFLVAGDRGGVIHIWRRHDGSREAADRPHRSWKSHQGRLWNLTTAMDREGLLSGGADGKLWYWERPLVTGESRSRIPDFEIQDSVFGLDSNTLYFVGRGNELRALDPWSDTLKELPSLSKAKQRRPLAVGMLPGPNLVAFHSDGAIEGMALSSGQTSFRLPTPWDASASFRLDDLATSEDGTRLAAFSYSHDEALVFDVPQRKRLGTFSSYSQAMALSTDGRRLALSDGDDVVVWSIDRGEPIARFRGHSSSIIALQFSHHGRWLASGSKDRHVRVWDLAGQRAPMRLEGHRDAVAALAFFRDDLRLASGDSGGELKFWYLPEAAELLSVTTPEPIRSLTFSPDGDRLSIQMDHEIRVLNARRAP